MELIKNLGFEVSNEADLTEEHKEIVRERIKTAKTEDLVHWKDARKELNFKGKR